MLNKPTVLAMTVAPLREALQQYGLDFDGFARRAGLDPDLLALPNARYATAPLQKLWELAAEESGDPVFGFRVGSLVRPGTFHALGLGIVSSTSVLAALNRIQRYSSIVSTNGRLVLLQQDGLVGLETRPDGMTVVPTIHCVDALVVGLCRILVQCAGPSAVPEKVVFMRPRMAPDSTAARVRSLLLKAMPSGEFDREAIARALNQSSSTLQRRLRDEGSSYQELLNATRHEMALEYLRQGRHSLVDVAFLLGFTDQSNFTRAFRRWTGKTPREYLS